LKIENISQKSDFNEKKEKEKVLIERAKMTKNKFPSFTKQ
jgi:hypothetical protein